MPVPERIVSLLSSATEILFAIGLGKRVVAVSHECDFPTAATDRPRVSRSLIASTATSCAIDDQVRELVAAGSALYGLDTERIGALCPDLIVTQSQCDVCAIRHDDVLQMVAADPRLSGTRVLALNPQRLSDVLEDVLRLGDATGARDEALEVVHGLKQRIEQVRQRTASLSIERRPRTICIEWLEPLMLAANWTPELIEWSGGRNDLTSTGRHSTYGHWEAVAQYNPEVILISPCGFDLPRTIDESQVLSRVPCWRELSAVRNQRVFAVDGNAYLNRAGPRLVDSLEILAQLIQPALFPDAPASARSGCWARVS